jgi:hypothetical protein
MLTKVLLTILCVVLTVLWIGLLVLNAKRSRTWVDKLKRENYIGHSVIRGNGAVEWEYHHPDGTIEKMKAPRYPKGHLYHDADSNRLTS